MKRILFTVLLVVLSGTLLASNMGFKLNYNLTNSGTVQTNWVSLPYFYLTAPVTAEMACDDIGGTCATLGNCIVGHWVEATDTDVYWSCQTAKGTPFTITAGEAIYVKVNAPEAWTVVGSHDPSLNISMTNTGTVQTNWISVPYHTTALNAEDLCDQIGGTCATLGNCIVGHWVETSDTDVYWSCQTAKGTPFSLTTGEGVYVKVNTPASFIPAHY
jgi:hypothetical protein